jgi:hypothetical protein
MMDSSYFMLRDSDLLFLIRILMPDCGDKQRMLRTLKEDEEILEGMLVDDKLFHYLIQDPGSPIRISPKLFFTVLLSRVGHDLEFQSYTVESDHGHSVAVFDSGDLARFVAQREIRSYLADMLVSFVRINSFTIPIRVRKGIWRKLRFSDFDIDSLISYSRTLKETQRFSTYRRIADICLFVTGVFPDYVDTERRSEEGRQRPLSQRNREGYEKNGKYFYRAAARHDVAQIQELNCILLDLSEKFSLAVKSLIFMADHYLGCRKERLFL